MSNHDELNFIIDEAKSYLRKNRNLNLTLRIKILRAYSSKKPEKSHEIRTNLAILCVEKVSPIWNEKYSTYNLPKELIKLAKSVVNGETSKDSALETANKTWARLDNLKSDGSFANIAGYTSVKAVYVATSDELWLKPNQDREEIEKNNLNDTDFDPYTWTVSYSASLAYGKREVGKTEEFWHWYLHEAVMKAYESVA
jgi:Immunity protein Imm5